MLYCRKTLLLLLATVASGAAIASPIDISGKVTSENGNRLDELRVQLGKMKTNVDASGRFAFTIDSNLRDPLLLRVTAKGHYPSLQAVHPADFTNDSAIPQIELVQRRAGRQLMLFAGDAMLSRRYFEPVSGEPVLVREASLARDARALLQHVKPFVELADYASVNLETQLSSEVLTDRLPKSVTFYSPPELADALRWAGFDYAALGNNHMFDYQDEGLRPTLKALQRSGLDFSGGGFDETQARKPSVSDINGQPHAFLSYVGWPGTFTPSQAAEADKGGAALASSAAIASDLGKLGDDAVAVLQLHAGLEYSAFPALSERSTLRQAVVDGADLVLGHHAHVLQGFEIYNDRLIAYSLGNFLFDQYHYTTQLGMLLFVWMDGDQLHRAEVVPMHVNGYVPTPATGAMRYSILHRLARLSDPASVCMQQNGLHATISACDAAQSQTVDVGSVAASSWPVHMRELGASPLHAIEIVAAGAPYRLGTDILRRGDFEYAGLYGTHDRTWIENSQVRIETHGEHQLRVEMQAGETMVRTGQKVFERIFSLSNPATVSGRIHVSGKLRLRVLLQRRRTSESLTDALRNDAITEIGHVDLTRDGDHSFVFDYAQPRISTRSVRLLFDIEDLSGDGATAILDDLSWIEWHSPWLQSGENAAALHATHLQFQP